MWTRCEAYLKGIGTGIAAGLGELSLTGDTPAGWRMRDLPAPNGFRAALAVRSAGLSRGRAAGVRAPNCAISERNALKDGLAE